MSTWAELEADRAQFDERFRPAPRTRCRWMSLWKAEQQGTLLPPVSVVLIGEAA